MKLFSKYNRINLLFTLIIFIAASISFYFLLRYVLIKEVDESLEIEKEEIEIYASKYDTLHEALPVEDQLISYKVVAQPEKLHFITLHRYDSAENENEPIRQIIFPVQVKNIWYTVTVSKSLERTENISKSIIIITLITILLILLASLLVNQVVLKKLWQPFYSTLNKMHGFSIHQNKPIELTATAIDEFAFMNKRLQEVTSKAQQDFLTLKAFTENASHEIQTPLAIINSKLDLLMQDESLSESQSHALHEAGSALQRLSRLNKSLLLLTRIENKQFKETSNIALYQKIEEKLSELKELIEDKNIVLTRSLQDAHITMNSDLADILLNNLIGNAIRHTSKYGEISVILTATHLQIHNTNGSALPKEELFKRFYKPVSTSDGNGLGLSIIKQICDVSGYTITNDFVKMGHEFVVRF